MEEVQSFQLPHSLVADASPHPNSTNRSEVMVRHSMSPAGTVVPQVLALTTMEKVVRKGARNRAQQQPFC